MPKTDAKAPRNGNKLMHPGAGDRTQTNPGPQPDRTKWIHPCKLWNSKIEALIDPVLAREGNCFAIQDILRGGNVSINDLPRLPKYQDSSGWSTICWTNVLCRRTYKDCPFKPQGGHVAGDDITDGFADAVCDKLGKGDMYVMSQEHGEHTAKKTKTMTGAATHLTAIQKWQRLPWMQELVENRNHVLFRDEAAWAEGTPHYERPSNTQKCMSDNQDSHPLLVYLSIQMWTWSIMPALVAHNPHWL